MRDAVPLAPLWPGFAINTLFYAAILWLLVAAPFALRRRWRIRRGLCPTCAYPIGSSDHCTECSALALREMPAKKKSLQRLPVRECASYSTHGAGRITSIESGAGAVANANAAAV
jgi:hypothetical protein